MTREERIERFDRSLDDSVYAVLDAFSWIEIGMMKRIILSYAINDALSEIMASFDPTRKNEEEAP